MKHLCADYSKTAQMSGPFRSVSSPGSLLRRPRALGPGKGECGS